MRLGITLLGADKFGIVFVPDNLRVVDSEADGGTSGSLNVDIFPARLIIVRIDIDRFTDGGVVIDDMSMVGVIAQKRALSWLFGFIKRLQDIHVQCVLRCGVWCSTESVATRLCSTRGASIRGSSCTLTPNDLQNIASDLLMKDLSHLMCLVVNMLCSDSMS